MEKSLRKRDGANTLSSRFYERASRHNCRLDPSSLQLDSHETPFNSIIDMSVFSSVASESSSDESDSLPSFDYTSYMTSQMLAFTPSQLPNILRLVVDTAPSHPTRSSLHQKLSPSLVLFFASRFSCHMCSDGDANSFFHKTIGHLSKMVVAIGNDMVAVDTVVTIP